MLTQSGNRKSSIGIATMLLTMGTFAMATDAKPLSLEGRFATTRSKTAR
jgi:hypothetical protein